MENVSAMAVDTVTMETPAQPKHKWLAKGSRLAKKAVLAATTFGVMGTAKDFVRCYLKVLAATTFGVMGATCATQAFAASGEVDTSSFITTACTVLKSVICLIGAGVGVWGVVNLLEGYGNDNPGAKIQGAYRSFFGFNVSCTT